jgi:hypothetical protein
MTKCAVCKLDYEVVAIDREWSEWMFPTLDMDDPTEAAFICPDCMRNALRIGLRLLSQRVLR